jgi:hypothetical protein
VQVEEFATVLARVAARLHVGGNGAPTHLTRSVSATAQAMAWEGFDALLGGSSTSTHRRPHTAATAGSLLQQKRSTGLYDSSRITLPAVDHLCFELLEALVSNPVGRCGDAGGGRHVGSADTVSSGGNARRRRRSRAPS